MRIRRLAAAAAITIGTVAGAAGVANAHLWAGSHVNPPHTHPGGACSNNGTSPSTVQANTCVRYILANGAVIQARKDYMDSQYGYVLVWCSFATNSWPVRWWPATWTYGPFGNNSEHPYCKSPVYYDPNQNANVRWSWTSP